MKELFEETDSSAAQPRMQSEIDLPKPALLRWQPMRGGLINLFLYGNEQFRFEGGRLLLRGNNGTGKSRILALQLPFLLDGEIAPHRMEPDRNRNKRPEWNLLLGKHRDRLGYTWLEFGRLDEDGTEHFVTFGCGLHAVQNRPGVDRWYFITSQRIDDTLSLIDGDVPHNKARLQEVLSDDAQFYTAVGDYRRAVNERLFKLGPRYESLLELLIQLRMPQLSRDLDEQKLSDALSGALPPLPTELLNVVAEAMRDLDESRNELRSYRESQKHVASFQEHYERYLKAGIRRRAASVTGAHSLVERKHRDINKASQELAETNAQINDTESRRQQTRQDHAAAESRRDTLRSSPEMQDARRLETARTGLDSSRAALQQQRKQSERMQVTRQRAEEDHAAAAAKVTASTNGISELVASIQQLGLPASLSEAVTSQLMQLAEQSDPGKHVEAVRKTVAGQQSGLRTLRDTARRIQELEHDIELELARLNENETRRDAARDRVQEQSTRLLQIRQQLAHAIREWHDAAQRLREFLPEAEELAFVVETTVDGADESGLGVQSVREAARSAFDQVARILESQQRTIAHRLTGIAAQTADAETELRSLRDGFHQPPPVPYTRDPDVRRSAIGAPLWTLCEFADNIPEAEHANWEAALEAAGLLDAWVTPDGRLLDNNSHDTTLLAAEPVPNEQSRLSCVLKASPFLSPDCPVSTATISKVLDSIGCGKGTAGTWVDADGSWQAGLLTGRWSKAESQHIGHAAQERRRQRRMAELESMLDELHRQRETLDEQNAELDRERAAAAAERDAVPDDRELLQVLATLEVAEADLQRMEDLCLSIQQRVGRQQTAVNDQISRRDRDAEDLRLTDWIDRLDELQHVLKEAEHGLNSITAELRRLAENKSELQRATERLERAVAEAAAGVGELRSAEETVSRREAECRTLEENVGASTEAVLAQIEDVQNQLRQLAEDIERLTDERTALIATQAKLQERLATAQQRLKELEEDRAGCIHHLQTTADAGLLANAMHTDFEVPPSPWSASRAVDVARAVNSSIKGPVVDEDAWDRLQNNVRDHFRTLESALLPAGHQPQQHTIDELIAVSIPHLGHQQSVRLFHETLGEEIRHRDALLTSRERELFEDRLIGDIAQELHTCIRDASKLVQRMNNEVERRPMSTGMRLSFKWRIQDDGPDGLKEARRALLQNPAALSDDQRKALGRFLQARIEQVRTTDEAGSWQQHLEQALDYRTWHTFDIMREQDGNWRRLTKRSHGTGSGGERAVALIVPMLAALAAYYESAGPHAPRIILMDEAFAGIDSDMRSKCMELLVTFDLDFVMTSESEWGCYPTVPSLGIYHLSTRPGVDAVLPTRWVWNGRERVQPAELPTIQREMFAGDNADGNPTG